MEIATTQDIKIRKTFTGKNALVEALKVSGFDPKVEKQVYIKAEETQKMAGFGGIALVEDAVDSYGSSRIFYTFECDIKLLNEFHPYCGVISDSPFHPAWIFADKITFQPEARWKRAGVAHVQKVLGYSCYGYKR